MIPPSYSKLPERFWSKIADEPDENGCWIWTGSRLPYGYGRLSWWSGTKWYIEYAHRLMYEDVHGSLDVEVVRHSCDNPPCVAPDHLLGGTYKDNMLDRDIRTGHGMAKLTDAQVIEMRQLASCSQWSAKRLAAKYPVSLGTIYSIIKGETWRRLLPD